MMVVAIGWQVYSIRHHPLDLGLVGLAEFLPLPLLALPAGQLADRVSRRTVAPSRRGCSSLIALVLLGDHRHRAALDLAVPRRRAARRRRRPPSALAGQRSLTPELVPSELLQGAIALRSVASQIGVVVGPASAG